MLQVCSYGASHTLLLRSVAVLPAIVQHTAVQLGQVEGTTMDADELRAAQLEKLHPHEDGCDYEGG